MTRTTGAFGRLGVPAWALLLAAGLGPGCRPAPADPGAAGLGRGPLRIAAASDLQRVLPRLVERYQAATGSVTTLTFGASGQLAEQVRAGAPFDVFLSANLRFVRELEAERLVESGSVRPYALGALALVVRSDSAPSVRTLADLERPEVRRIAIANPRYAPYGVAARQALERSGLWGRLEPKLVMADSVRQALAYAEQGDVEAAPVGRSIAPAPGIEAVPVDPALHEPIVQGLGVVAGSAIVEEARGFAAYVLGEQGQAILREDGFLPPPGATPTPSPAPAPGSAAPTPSPLR